MPTFARYPFLFWNQSRSKFIVVIGSYDFKEHDFRWADDAQVGKFPLVPDVDIAHEYYNFGTEYEAMVFIKNWWAWYTPFREVGAEP